MFVQINRGRFFKNIDTNRKKFFEVEDKDEDKNKAKVKVKDKV
jgi:hypothetical protein